MKKSLLAIALCLVLALSLLPMSAFAEEFSPAEEAAFAWSPDDPNTNATVIGRFLSYINANGTPDEQGNRYVEQTYEVDGEENHVRATYDIINRRLELRDSGHQDEANIVGFVVENVDVRCRLVLNLANMKNPRLASPLELEAESEEYYGLVTAGNFELNSYSDGATLHFQGKISIRSGAGSIEINESKDLDDLGTQVSATAFKAWKQLLSQTVGGSMNDLGMLAYDQGTVTGPEAVKIGDVNGDAMVNGKDLILLRRYLAGNAVNGFRFENADVNEDGSLNGKDLILMRRNLAG